MQAIEAKLTDYLNSYRYSDVDKRVTSKNI